MVATSSNPGAGLGWYDPTAALSPAARPAARQVTRQQTQPPPPPPAPPAPSAPPAPPPQGPVHAGDKEEAADTGSSSSVEPEAIAPAGQAATSREEIDAQEQAPSEARPDTATRRILSSLEVQRTVDEATKAKEELARHSINRARDEVLAQRQALKVQMEEQERRLKHEEDQLAQLDRELRSGVGKDEGVRIKALRSRIEAAGREVNLLEREVASRKESMRRATDAYVDAEERLTQKRSARQKMEEEMLDLVLATGRNRDARLTGLLLQVPNVSSNGTDPNSASQTSEGKRQSVS